MIQLRELTLGCPLELDVALACRDVVLLLLLLGSIGLLAAGVLTAVFSVEAASVLARDTICSSGIVCGLALDAAAGLDATILIACSLDRTCESYLKQL
jgi:hypothetical protein